MFLFFYLRRSLLKRNNLLLMLFVPLLMVTLCFVIQQNAANQTYLYRCAIIDEDRTALSRHLLEEMSHYPELKTDFPNDKVKALRDLSRSRYDVIYIIHSGFEEKLHRSEMNHLLTLHAQADTPSVKWVNDQISLKIMRLWSYYDILNRIRIMIPDYAETTYQNVYRHQASGDELLTLNLKYPTPATLINRKSDIGSEIFFLLWIYLILFLSMASGRRFVEDRLSTILDRLEFSGIQRPYYLLCLFTTLLLKILLPLALSLFMMNSGFFRLISEVPPLPVFDFRYVLGLSFLFTLVSWTICCLIARLSPSVQSYNFVTQLLLILLILLTLLL